MKTLALLLLFIAIPSLVFAEPPQRGSVLEATLRAAEAAEKVSTRNEILMGYLKQNESVLSVEEMVKQVLPAFSATARAGAVRYYYDRHRGQLTTNQALNLASALDHSMKAHDEFVADYAGDPKSKLRVEDLTPLKRAMLDPDKNGKALIRNYVDGRKGAINMNELKTLVGLSDSDVVRDELVKNFVALNQQQLNAEEFEAVIKLSPYKKSREELHQIATETLAANTADGAHGPLKLGETVYDTAAKELLTVSKFATKKGDRVVELTTPGGKTITLPLKAPNLRPRVLSHETKHGPFKFSFKPQSGVRYLSSPEVFPIEQVFHGGYAIRNGAAGKEVIELGQATIAADEINVLRRQVKSKIIDVWNENYAPLVRADLPGPGRDLHAAMLALADDAVENPGAYDKKALALFKQYPGLPEDVADAMKALMPSVAIGGQEIQRPATTAEDKSKLFYEQSQADLWHAAKDLIRRIPLFVAGHSGTGQRAARLRELLAELKLPTKVDHTDPSYRDHLDKVANELLTGYPELPADIKQSIAELMRTETEAVRQAVAAAPVYGPDSLVEPEAVAKLRREHLVPLAKSLDTFLLQSRPANSRVKRLRSISPLLNKLAGGLITGNAGESDRISLMHALVAELAKDFPDLGSTILTNAKAIAPEAAGTASPTTEASRLPLEFDKATKDLMGSVGNVIKYVQGITFRSNPEIPVRTLLDLIAKAEDEGAIEKAKDMLGLHGDVDYVKLVPKMMAYLIEHYPNVPREVRETFLSFVPDASVELRQLAHATPRPAGQRLVDEIIPPAALSSWSRVVEFRERAVRDFTVGYWRKTRKQVPLVIVGESIDGKQFLVVPATEFEEALERRNAVDVYEVPVNEVGAYHFGDAFATLVEETARKGEKGVGKGEKPVMTIYIPHTRATAETPYEKIHWSRKALRQQLVDALNTANNHGRGAGATAIAEKINCAASLADLIGPQDIVVTRR